MNILCIIAKGFKSPNTFLFLVELLSTKNIAELAIILGNNPWTLMQLFFLNLGSNQCFIQLCKKTK
jgi:hypothetical protein